MKLSAPLALCLLAAGCAGPASQVKEGGAVRTDLAGLDRAILGIEAAELRGDVLGLRQQYAAQWEAKPGSAAARFLALYARKRDEATWTEFKAMSRELPDSALGWVGQARIYVGWKVWDQLDKVIDSGFEADPDNWMLVIPRALGNEGRGRFDAAAGDWKMVLQVDANNPEALLGRSRALRRAGDAEGAKAAAEAALAAFPGWLPAFLTLGELATAAGDKQGAAEMYGKAVEVSPGDRALRVTYAKLLSEKGDAAGALAEWKAILALKEDPETLVSLAAAARAAGDVQAEEKAIERISAVDPGAAEWKRVAEIRAAAGDASGAEAALRRSLTRDPKDAATNAALGRLLVARGDFQGAMEALRLSGDAGRPDRASLEGRLNVEALQKPDVGALQKAAGSLIEKTYKGRLTEWPNLAGNLKIRVTVDPAGAATLVEILEDSLDDAAVRACAYWNLHDAAYPPKKPGRFTFAFALRPPR